MDRGPWRATIHGVSKELDTSEQLTALFQGLEMKPQIPNPDFPSLCLTSHACVFVNSLGAFSLSVKDVTTQGEVIKHYKIRSLDEGGYYISPRSAFPTLQALVQHYSSKTGGI